MWKLYLVGATFATLEKTVTGGMHHRAGRHTGLAC